MKRNIKKEMVMARKLAIIVIATGILFALIACILFFKKDILQVFPRMDIAWVGFLVVAILLCVSGIWVFSISGKKQDWINETDERESLITAKANMVGYVIQTTLLGIVFFLLVFMGYLNKVSGFSIIGVVLISGIVSWIYHLYLRKVE
ncbi:hypothetical protein [Streptococcus equi]|uniref:Membrane protein n=2 Tax=Streptococcus equi TaxID=1336 RepID=A0A7Z8ZVW2_STRSZ|nr:hypothetical protein [Streptococcus equi]ASB96920.1 putative membrane protein [Streptococcus equi subsp. equi]MDI5953858.1 hypothetical protein [Streptococcus equi subsp. zooepidemicus]MDI6043519.1 hypothetical protein [Streptococcus equi subsp. zooepidemicus]MDI6076183.1 hypothetical protein [Streptococcus equi subsp. zooepidemicus]QTZ58975.1 hypothetical protein MCPGFBBE_01077 [Streptococcus equi subsp. zooepidemicus]